MPTIAYLPPLYLPALPLAPELAADRVRFVRVQPAFGETQTPSQGRSADTGPSLSTRERLAVHTAGRAGASADVQYHGKADSAHLPPADALVAGSSAVPAPSDAAAEATPAKRRRDDSDRRRSRRLAGSLSHDDTAPPDSLLSSLASSLPPTAPLPTSSISLLPTWTVPLDRLTPLHTLASTDAAPARYKGWGYTFSVLACVIEAGGVVEHARKQPRAPGALGRYGSAAAEDDMLAVASWKVTAPPDRRASAPAAVEVKMWDRVARECAGVRKGDVVLIEKYKHATARGPAHLSLSASARPRVTILYRTLPRTGADGAAAYVPAPAAAGGDVLAEDRRLRPDLRVAGDPGVRRVADYAHWLADWIGGMA